MESKQTKNYAESKFPNMAIDARQSSNSPNSLNVLLEEIVAILFCNCSITSKSHTGYVKSFNS